MKVEHIYILVVVAFGWSCTTRSPERLSDLNPPAEDFDLAHSDPAAVELADSIMVSMGGRHNWDEVRFITWSFSGKRDLTWDKRKGRVRIVSHKDSTIYLIDLNTKQGRVRVKGTQVSEEHARTKALSVGMGIWDNDSYWLFMPFRLKDSGVTLKYMGEDVSLKGEKCNVLQLTKNQTGDNNQPKYMIYVDRADNLVKQWAYYTSAMQDTSDFTRPWDNYAKRGAILLSSNRSDGEGPTDVKVEKDMPNRVFTEF